MADDYKLVPEIDSSGSETGYYTREPDGISGMTVRALAEFVGTSPAAVTQLLNRVRDSDPLTNTLPESLERFSGMDLRLLTNDLQGRLIVFDEACQAVAEYYAFDARDFEGKEIAIANCRAILRAGIRIFIWTKTGYNPPVTRQESRGTYWYSRVRLALSDASSPLQSGYFCAYLEMMKFFQELETYAGYIVLDTNPQTNQYIVPDISIAKMFNAWLRDDKEESRKVRLQFLNSESPIDFREKRQNKDKDTSRKVWVPEGSHRNEVVTYNHVYPEASHPKNNIIAVNSYPDKYLSIFKYFLSKFWVPIQCDKYISERDPIGWESAKKNLSQLPPSTRQALSGTFIGGLFPLLPSADK